MKGARGRAVAAAAVAVVSALATAPEASAAACRDADRPVHALAHERVPAAAMCVINDIRVRRGLPPLALEPRLMWSARRQSATMLRTRTLRHAARVAGGSGYRSTGLAENIGFGQRSVRRIVRDWLRSRPHCGNLMATGWTETGIAVSRRSFYWTQVFGRPLGSGRASRARDCRVGLDGRDLGGGGGRAALPKQPVVLAPARTETLVRLAVKPSQAGRHAVVTTRVTPRCVLEGTRSSTCTDEVRHEPVGLVAPTTEVGLPAVPAGALLSVHVAVQGPGGPAYAVLRQYR